jgi:coproporphyrinogen III oxidase
MTDIFDERKARAAGWFRELRDAICDAFEAAEDAHTEGPGSDLPAGRFELHETRRKAEEGRDSGGGLMSVMRGGRLFEKVGVNVSAVYGELEPRARRSLTARKEIPGLEEDPRFWASGISLVAHMRNPHVPAVHLNTRMFWTPGAWWFGGGTDLNPAIEYAEDTADFHRVLEDACTTHGAALYPRYKAWADEYFFVPHRKRARGVGGVFYDDHCTGDWEADLAFTQDVGRAFLPAFLPLVERRRGTVWSEADKEAQLVHRGLYAEYNLVYDRGTKFGLETGHDPDAVLMSLPPYARWI